MEIPYEVISKIAKKLDSEQRHKILFCLCRSFREISLNVRKSRLIFTKKALVMSNSQLYMVTRNNKKIISQEELSSVTNVLTFRNTTLKINNKESLRKIQQLSFRSDITKVVFENEFSEEEETVLDLRNIAIGLAYISIKENSTVKSLKILLNPFTRALSLGGSAGKNSPIPVTIVSEIKELYRLSFSILCYQLKELQNITKVVNLYLGCLRPDEAFNSIVQKLGKTMNIENLQINLFLMSFQNVLDLCENKNISLKMFCFPYDTIEFTLKFETETIDFLSLNSLSKDSNTVNLLVLGAKKIKILLFKLKTNANTRNRPYQINIGLLDELEIEKVFLCIFTDQGTISPSDVEICVNHPKKFVIGRLFFSNSEVGDGKNFNISSISPTQLKITGK